MEIERKFLVSEVPGAARAATVAVLRQGYLAIGSDSEARVREASGEYTLTVKSVGTLSRDEYEIALTGGQFEALWPATVGRRVEKRRYRLDASGATVELDVYEGDLAGLIVAEVEFASESAAAGFEPPEWFGDEVTADPRYKNASLALDGRPAQP
ncbi:MAG: CYTH domain-containing protein [Coriobacteriia bacterium]|nr:CYTH domain-containing protein [Coriobacteriia bacterium]